MTVNARFATVFGIGRIPYAPGTAASLVAVLIALPVLWYGGWIAMAALTLAATGFGVWVSDGYGVETDTADPSDCVIDEFAGQWLACTLMGLAGPPEDAGAMAFRFAAAFLLFRLFDIAKPWPVDRAERLRGGLGIMADDIVAGLIAGGVVFLFADAGLI